MGDAWLIVEPRHVKWFALPMHMPLDWMQVRILRVSWVCLLFVGASNSNGRELLELDDKNESVGADVDDAMAG